MNWLSLLSFQLCKLRTSKLHIIHKFINHLVFQIFEINLKCLFTVKVTHFDTILKMSSSLVAKSLTHICN